MNFIKKAAVNLLVVIISTAVVFGGLELGFRTFGGKRIKTYFDGQTELALGSPVPKKMPGEYRIFLFGSSAAYGFPVSDRYSITAWLRKSFPHLLPGKTIKVVNCAWPGKASYHVLEGVRSILKYHPDLLIIYAGNNEATESNRLYLDSWPYWMNLRLSYESAFYCFLKNRLDRIRRKIQYGNAGHVEKKYAEEVVGSIVYANRATVTHDDYERILKHYVRNMEQVIRIANRRKIPVLITTVPTNLRDIPPGISLHHIRLTAKRLKQWEDYFAEAGKLGSKGNYPGAGWAYERALAIDPTYAELQFKAAKNYEKLGEYAKAKAAYAASRDYDGRPYRATSSMNEAVRNLAEEHQLIFTDTNAALERLSPHGIIGRELIYDNVHPTVGAQQIIAEEILRALERRGWPLPAADWRWKALEKAREDTSREEWKVDGNSNAYRYILRGLYLWENRYYPEAAVDLEKGLELMPSYLDSYVFLGDCYFRTGRREEARAAFQRLFEKDPDLLQFLLKKYPDINDSYSKITYGV